MTAWLEHCEGREIGFFFANNIPAKYRTSFRMFFLSYLIHYVFSKQVMILTLFALLKMNVMKRSAYLTHLNTSHLPFQYDMTNVTLRNRSQKIERKIYGELAMHDFSPCSNGNDLNTVGTTVDL